jgi:hypothetical protein
MKKFIVIASLTTSLTGLSAFGQGYFQFTTGKSQVWDCFSSGSPQLATTVNVAFLWGANGAVPAVGSLMASTPASGFPTYTTSAAWTAILTDPNFTLAVNNANSQVAVAQSAAGGSITYNGGTAFGVSGTSPSVAYSLFMVGWDANYATPALASVANAAVGWSAPFTYTATAFTAVPTSMSGRTAAFGVWGIPEPSTLVMAGFGSLFLLLFRRRK